MTTILVDLTDPTDPPIVDLGDRFSPPVIDLNWSTTVEIPIGVGIQGPVGPAGGGALVFTLTNVSSQTFTHDFAYPPNVHLVEGGELALIGVEYVDATHVSISFPAPFTGQVVIS